MHEHIILPASTAEQANIRKAALIGGRAIAAVDAQYGSGMPLWIPGLRPMPYHNGFHGRQVGNDGSILADRMGLGPELTAWTKAIGEAHDISSHLGRGTDEAKSAEWMVAQMEYEQVGDERLRLMAKLAIEGTEPLFNSDGSISGQKVTELEFPSKEAETVGLSVSSGDFGMLYRPGGPLVGHLFAQELTIDKPFDPDWLLKFQRNQVGLVQSYQYPLAGADRILATHRGPVLEYSDQVLEQLERGELTSWDEVLNQDAAFMRSHQ